MRTAEDLDEAGHRYLDSPLTIKASAWMPESTKDQAIVRIVTTQTATQVVDGVGRVVERTSSEPVVSEVELRWRYQSWLVDGITHIVTSQ